MHGSGMVDSSGLNGLLRLIVLVMELPILKLEMERPQTEEDREMP
jgi:hypothetical protein